MKYNILALADLHFGALNPERLEKELDSLLYTIKNISNIHLLVINGDYWDSKQSLNNKVSTTGISFMHTLWDLALTKKFVIRVILGTKSHDYDQLDVFNSLENEFFKIIRENTLEETLPGLYALYLPDENIKTKDYEMKYIDNFINDKIINIGFFHGNFDVIMENIPLQETEIQSTNNVIFGYQYWNSLIDGPLIAGHWHTHKNIDNLSYIGSYSRFGFNEEDPKGFMFICYNTDNNSYYTKFIENKEAQEYKSYIIDTRIFHTIDDYSNILNKILEEINQYEDMKVRIRIDVTDDKIENEKYIDYIKNFFINSKRIKIVVRQKMKEKEKKKKDHEKKEEDIAFGFIEDKNMDEAIKIQKFILTKYKSEIPIDFIKKYTMKIKDKIKK